MMVTLPPMPPFIERLKRDDRGYPVPWFVAWVNDQPEFRVADGAKFVAAIKQKLCWVCGNFLNREQVFVMGPMCTITRTTAEPPCHLACAEFSAKACPFLSMPKACRRDANIPEGAVNPAGISIDRNPGCSALWDCHSRPYSMFSDGRGGRLFRVPDPDRVTWWAEGRAAKRDEVLESMQSGKKLLFAVTGEKPDRAAIQEFKKARKLAMQYLPV